MKIDIWARVGATITLDIPENFTKDDVAKSLENLTHHCLIK